MVRKEGRKQAREGEREKGGSEIGIDGFTCHYRVPETDVTMRSPPKPPEQYLYIYLPIFICKLVSENTFKI